MPFDPSKDFTPEAIIRWRKELDAKHRHLIWCYHDSKEQGDTNTCDYIKNELKQVEFAIDQSIMLLQKFGIVYTESVQKGT